MIRLLIFSWLHVLLQGIYREKRDNLTISRFIHIPFFCCNAPTTQFVRSFVYQSNNENNIFVYTTGTMSQLAASCHTAPSEHPSGELVTKDHMLKHWPKWKALWNAKMEVFSLYTISFLFHSCDRNSSLFPPNSTSCLPHATWLLAISQVAPLRRMLAWIPCISYVKKNWGNLPLSTLPQHHHLCLCGRA